MPTEQKPVQTEATPVGPGANMSLWTAQPLLPPPLAGAYYGRLFAEVWDKDVRVVTVGAFDLLKARALAALQGQFTPHQEANRIWTEEPATGTITSQAFLGRVVVEVWSDQAVVGATSTDPRLLHSVLHALSSYA